MKLDMHQRLQEGIRRAVDDFNRLAAGLSDTDFERPHGPKWSAGQDLKHLVKTLRAVQLAISIPLPLLRMLFGKPSRKGRSEAELKEKFRKALGKGFKAPRLYRPGKVRVEDRAALIKKHARIAEALCQRMARLSEREMESYLLPHPAMGKSTLREMVVFSVLHAEHHTRLLKAKLDGKAAEEL